jgi:hypothetical protein
MNKFWMFLAAGAFAFGLLTSQAEAKDLNKIGNMDKLDKIEAMDKQLGVHVDLPANVGAGGAGLQGIQNRPAAPARTIDAPFSNAPHAPGVLDHG